MRKNVGSTVMQRRGRIADSSSGRSGSVQQALINLTGCYRIEVVGARGGKNNILGFRGGNGALAAASFVLTAGTWLAIAVGQAGASVDNQEAGAGGGGGSFVYRKNDSQLMMAAGGGGGASSFLSGEKFWN